VAQVPSRPRIRTVTAIRNAVTAAIVRSLRLFQIRTGKVCGAHVGEKQRDQQLVERC
jgi:hypothetical protein